MSIFRSLILLFICFGLMNSCGKPAGRTLGGSSQFTAGGAGADGTVFVDDSGEFDEFTVQDLQTELQARSQEDSSSKEEYAILTSINQAFCERLNKLRTECVAAARIMPSSSDRALACDGNFDAVSKKHNISVTFKGGRGKWVLIANDTFQSSPFGSGTSDITFSSTGNDDVKAPQLKEISKLYIRSMDGAVNAGTRYTFSLSVDGVVLLQGGLLPLPDSGSDNTLLVSVSDIQMMAMSNTCRVSPSELTGIKEQVKSQVTAQLVQDRREGYSAGGSSSSSNRGALIQKILQHRMAINEIFPVLEDERSRNLALTNSLKSDLDVGCQMNELINELKIEVTGAHTAISNLLETNDNGWKNPSGNQGLCQQVEFRFGPDLAFSIDQSKHSIIGSPGTAYIASSIPEGAKIGSVEYVSVLKKAVCFDNTAVKEREMMFFEKTRYEVREKHQMSINRIKITINGMEAYNTSVDLLFDYKHTKPWKDPKFRENPAWVELMTNTNCNVTE